MFEQIIDVERIEDLIDLFGNFDVNIKLIEKKYGVAVTSMGNRIKIKGEPMAVNDAVRTVKGLIVMIKKGEEITDRTVEYVSSLVEDGEEENITSVTDADCICITAKGKPIKPKTLGQKKYIDAIKNNTVTIGVGPAGTGKTYLAVAAAVSAFREIGRAHV